MTILYIVLNRNRGASTEDDRLVFFIFASYPAEMDRFLSCNAGLTRRITHNFRFADYIVEELSKIFIIKCKDVTLGLADDVSEEDVSNSIGCVDVDIRSQHNAGICERHLKYCMDGISARYVASLDDGSLINDPVAVRRVLCTITSHDPTTSITKLCADLQS